MTSADKNKDSWNRGAAKYSALVHSETSMKRVISDRANAFHRGTRELLKEYAPDLRGKRICVPSSGDNHAVFAFAMMGARVVSCDISENQLANAERVAKEQGWDTIEFIRADTMKLEGIEDSSCDFVYTSNGVHVWIEDLPGMYRNIHRVMKPGGFYLMHEIHPFLRPFDDNLKVIKPYDATGPHETETETTFSWRIMDIMNAIAGSGLVIKRVLELSAEKDYDWPFMISLEDKLKGVSVSREEADRMYDWRSNPMAALPNWIDIAAVKQR